MGSKPLQLHLVGITESFAQMILPSCEYIPAFLTIAHELTSLRSQQFYHDDTNEKASDGGFGALGSRFQSCHWFYVQRDEPPWLFYPRVES